MSAKRGENSGWVSDVNMSDTKKQKQSKIASSFWRLVMESEIEAGSNSDPCTE